MKDGFGLLKGAIFSCSVSLFAREPIPVQHDLVSVDTVQPPCLVEARYATRHNFTGEVLYPSARLLMRRETARALSAVQRDLASRGLGLKVWDAYRPLSVQQKMWDLVRDERYVSDPSKNKGRHTRGTAVDVTLVDKAGRELPMPSDFDDFSERAHRDGKSATEEQRRNSRLLEETMHRHGFVGLPSEWWHFDLKGWERFPPADIPIVPASADPAGAVSSGQVEHIVLVWLKRPGNEADKAKLIRASEGLRLGTGLIRAARYGGPLSSDRPEVDDSFDLALLMTFASSADLGRFATDISHRKAIEEVLRPLAAKVRIHDIVTITETTSAPDPR
jgi:D-alanyl-D-alanine dipeptidase